LNRASEATEINKIRDRKINLKRPLIYTGRTVSKANVCESIKGALNDRVSTAETLRTVIGEKQA